MLDDQVTDWSVALDGVTEAVNAYVSPSVIDKVLLSKLTPVTEMIFAFTLTEHEAVFDPSFVFTVIVAEPTAFAVTTPKEETVATEVLLDDQVTDWSVALDGVTIAVNASDSPSVNEIVLLSKTTPVTGTTLAFTVTLQVAVLPRSFVFTVIVAVPTDCAVKTPKYETETTEGLLEVHVTVLSEARVGVIIAVKDWESPSVMVSVVEERSTDSTGTYTPLLPSCKTGTLIYSFCDWKRICPSRL